MALLSAGMAGCEDSAPRYPLRLVMLEVEAARKDLEAELLSADGLGDAVAAAARLQRWMTDPARERFLEIGSLRGDPALFRSCQSEADAALGALLAAARAGDAESTRNAYARVRAACDRCHATFRPELLGVSPR